MTEPVAMDQATVPLPSSAKWLERANPLNWSAKTFKIGVLVLLVFLLAELGWLAWRTFLPSYALSRMAVVDVDGVLQSRREQFVAMLSRPNVTDADREKAYEFVKLTSQQVNSALAQVMRDCQCLVLVKTAVHNPQMVKDLTPQVKDALQAAQSQSDTKSGVQGDHRE